MTCPGVCLCPSGDVELSLTCLQYHFRTAPKSPRFPILLHETFTVNGFYREYFARREEFERMLSAEPLECNLWQNGRRLAHFKGPLINLLDSDSVRTLRSSGNGFPCDLILKPSTCFPGIIGPKCVMRVEMDVVERHQKSTSAQLSSAASMALWANWRPHRSHSCWPTDDGYDESAGPLSSVTAAATVPHCKKCRRLQKPVCHARQRCTTRFVSFDKSYSPLTRFTFHLFPLCVLCFHLWFSRIVAGTSQNCVGRATAAQTKSVAVMPSTKRYSVSVNSIMTTIKIESLGFVLTPTRHDRHDRHDRHRSPYTHIKTIQFLTFPVSKNKNEFN